MDVFGQIETVFNIPAPMASENRQRTSSNRSIRLLCKKLEREIGHYAAILADLRTKREEIGAAIEALDQKLHDLTPAVRRSSVAELKHSESVKQATTYTRVRHTETLREIDSDIDGVLDAIEKIRVRLNSLEALVAQRQEQAAQADIRRLQKELDDIAGQRWARARDPARPN